MSKSTTSIKDKIIQQIRFNKDLALGALINYLGDEAKGDLAMENSKFTNIFLPSMYLKILLTLL